MAFHFHLQRLYTPLHVAAKGGHHETCEVLVANGAEVNAPAEVRSKFFLSCAEWRLYLLSHIILAKGFPWAKCQCVWVTKTFYKRRNVWSYSTSSLEWLSHTWALSISYVFLFLLTFLLFDFVIWWGRPSCLSQQLQFECCCYCLDFRNPDGIVIRLDRIFQLTTHKQSLRRLFARTASGFLKSERWKSTEDN